MATQKYIAFADIPAWLEELSAAQTVYAPRREGKAVVYRPWQKGEQPELVERPTESAKHIVFPRAEELFRFNYQQAPETGGSKKLSLAEPADPAPAVVFAALPCDTRGFLFFDPVYSGSGTNGKFQDIYYLKRRACTTLITRTCRAPLATCFCNWTGGGPANREGADVLSTDVEGGLFLEALTEKGEAVLKSAALSPATEAHISAAQSSRDKAARSMGDAPDLGRTPPALISLFENLDFWREQSAGCLSCGACTYLCPTCYCFNITDESNGISGVRLRSWDACMFALFTLEASGHNPRNGRAARLRNRVGHKFSYYPGLHEGRFSCCGCGRCIKSCPSSIDIRRIVQNALAATEASRG